MRVVKRDYTTVPFDIEKVRVAIRKANYQHNFVLTETEVLTASNAVFVALEAQFDALKPVPVDVIQECVIKELYKLDEGVADSYAKYMHKRNIERQNTTDDAIKELLAGTNDELNTENSNKDSKVNSTIRDLMAGIQSVDAVERWMYPKHIIKAHKEGTVYQHDRDYLIQKMTNCCLVNLEDMLQNGTMINGNMIETPKSFHTACTVATQAVMQIASSQYGGTTISLAHISPFVDVSRRKFKERTRADYEAIGVELTEEQLDALVAKQVKREIATGVQTIQYQLETITGTNGQSPFISINMDLNEAKTEQERTDLALVIEEVLKQRIKGIKNRLGIYVAPAFPKLLYVLDGGVNAKPNDEYYWLTELAAVCSTKRLVPDYISAKKMRELKNGQVYPNMGCRSFLTPDYKDAEGNYKFYGRFNWNVITVNLPDVALSANGNIERFWEILDERLALVKEGHMIRFEYLKNTPSDVAPILWQHGALARKKPGETIEGLFYNSYSTVSVGYAGLYETVKALIGESHTTEAGRELGLSILQRMNDRAEEWKAETGLNFSVYGSPIESVTSKFAEGLKKRFGIIEGLTDKPYITNSYHVHVQEEIDAFSKLSFEAPFQALSPGGAISYIEMPNMQKNIPAVLAVIDHIYENMLYAELNTKADCCMKCGYEGEILTDEQLNWYCPNCNNTDKNYLQVVRRTCG